MGEVKRTYLVGGVCCAMEEAVVRKALDANIGAAQYTFSLLTSELTVDDGVDEGMLLRTLRRTGFMARRKNSSPVQETWIQRHRQAAVLTFAGVLGIAGGLLSWDTPGSLVARMFLALSMIVGGWPIARKAWGALRTRSLDMNVLMCLAVIGAVAIDRWTEGAAVIVLFSVAVILESYSTSRTKRAVQSLMDLSPRHASVLRGGVEMDLPAEQIELDDVIIVRPGEQIPIDGIVIGGTSLVNQATITGESRPVPAAVDTSVFAGTLNERGVLHIRATRRYEDTTLSHIIHLVAQAEQHRAPVQGTIDRFAALYTPVVLLLALALAVVPPLVLGASFSEWLYRALVVLVIACPCALVISTPVTIVSALTNAARRGILIKGGKSLEVIASVQAIAFDKTGTLTEGSPRVTDILPLNGTSEETLLCIAGALEGASEHHLASAILDEVALRGIDTGRIHVDKFEALPGRGVRGMVGGTVYFLGNSTLAVEQGCAQDAVEPVCDALAAEGKTAVVLGSSGMPFGVIAMKDAVRAGALQTVVQLSSLGLRRTVMLSGDSSLVAKHIAGSVGITEWVADLLPEQKMEVVQKLKAQYGVVAMVGDGINDAPALAASSVGVAMGGIGSDTALETADVVLISDNLHRLPHLIALSKKTLKVIKQNIALALGLKLVFLLLSLAGFATLWMAVLADDGAALLVIANALRMLRFES